VKLMIEIRPFKENNFYGGMIVINGIYKDLMR
jgi:hypothetical protein